MATSPTEQQNNRRTTFIGGKVKIQIRISINWWKFNEILQRILTRQVMLLNNSWWHNYSRNKSMCYFKAPNWLNLVDVLINNKAKLSIQFQWTSNWTQYYSQKYTSTSHSFLAGKLLQRLSYTAEHFLTVTSSSVQDMKKISYSTGMIRITAGHALWLWKITRNLFFF